MGYSSLLTAPEKVTNPARKSALAWAPLSTGPQAPVRTLL